MATAMTMAVAMTMAMATSHSHGHTMAMCNLYGLKYSLHEYNMNSDFGTYCTQYIAITAATARNHRIEQCI